MRHSAVVLALTLLLPCVRQLNAQQFTAQRILRVGEEEGVSFGQITGLAATPAGAFYVLDAMESRILAFSPAGKRERAIGKRGAGPGELSNRAAGLVLWHDQLVVVDPMNARISLFTTDGGFVHSRPLNLLQGVPLSFAAAGNRIFYILRPMPAMLAAQTGGVTRYAILSVDPRTNTPPDTLLRIDLPLDTEMSMSGAELKMKMNLAAPHLQLAGNGTARLLLASTDTYRIRVMSPEGRTTGWIARSLPRQRISRAEAARLKKELDSTMLAGFKAGAAAGAARAGRRTPDVPMPDIELIMPEYAPAIGGVIAGDRMVLVARGTASTRAVPEWDLLSYDGRFLGSLRLPAGFAPHAFVGDRLFGVEKDDLDVESVAVYRITPAHK